MPGPPSDTRPRRTIWPEGVCWDERLASSPAVSAGGWVFSSNQLPTDYRNALAPEAAGDPGNPFAHSAVEKEAAFVIERLRRTFAAAGADLATEAARMYWWLPARKPTLDGFADGSNWTGIEDLTPVHEAREREVTTPAPGSTGIGVRELLAAEASISTAAIAVEIGPGRERQSVPAPASMAPIPDTPAVRFGDWIFTVGVIASDWHGDFGSELHLGPPSLVDPATRTNPYVWFGSEVEAQMDQMLETLSAIADQAGCSLDRCVKAEVYLGHPRDLYAVERAWRRWFPERPPARTLMPYSGISGAGCRAEIALVLLAGEEPLHTIETSEAPEPLWHEPQAIRAGDLLFVSNQLPLGNDGVVPPALRAGGAFPHLRDTSRNQAELVLENIDTICRAGGTGLDQVCRRTAFYSDLRHFTGAAAAWRSAFAADQAPAAIDLGVGRDGGWPLLVPEALMQVDAIAYAGRQ